MLIRCPGCGARFAFFDGPAHLYIGASPACWALYGALLVNAAPDLTLVRGALAPDVLPELWAMAEFPGAEALLVDAYAVQHHGDGSSQAVQSVAAHLLALHAVLRQGVSAEHVQWVRRRALRRRGVFRVLEPPPEGSAFTILHLVDRGGRGPVSIPRYVASVFAAWERLHATAIEQWYADYVLAE